MPASTRRIQRELSELIREQQKDQSHCFVHPERITPRKPVLFSNLTLRQHACFVLSFSMKRSQIATLLKIDPASVSKHRKRGMKLLNSDDVYRFRRIRFAVK